MFQLFETDSKSKGKGFDYISLLIYAYIFSFCKDGKSHWYGKQQKLAEMVHADESVVCKKLKALVDNGLILRERVELYGMFHHNNYYINWQYDGLRKIPVVLETTVYDLETTVDDLETTVDDLETTNNKSIYINQLDKSLEEDKSSPSLLVEKNNNKDISDSTAATSVRAQVYAAYPELSETIIKWYDAVGIKKKLSFNQIRDKLEKLEKECNGDAKLIEQQINHSYMNGYLAWYPPQNIKKNSVSNSVSTRPGEVDKSGYRNYI